MYLIIDVSVIQTTLLKSCLFPVRRQSCFLVAAGGAIFVLCHSTLYMARLFRFSQGQHIVVTFLKTNQRTSLINTNHLVKSILHLNSQFLGRKKSMLYIAGRSLGVERGGYNMRKISNSARKFRKI